MIQRAYHRTVPESIRRPVWLARERLRTAGHRALWNFGPSRRITAWTDRRLELGPYYWLFVVGSNNSGTTLLLRILERHPEIRTLGTEGQLCTDVLPRPPDLGMAGLFTRDLERFRWTEDSTGASVERLRYDWAARFSGRPPGVLLEKSPPNSLRSRWLQRHFRPSRFVVLTRNPYAVCEGNRRRRGHSIEEAAMHWAVVHETILEDMPRLDSFLVLSYEELVDSPLRAIHKLQGFLDLKAPFSEDLEKQRFTVHSIEGKRSERSITNYNDASLARLSKSDFETITRIAGKTMRRFGYEVIQPPL